MTRFLCRKCRIDLTSTFIKAYEGTMKVIYPQLMAIKESLKVEGATNIKIDVRNIGGDVHCPKCGMVKEIRLDNLDQLEEIIMGMNR